MKVNFAAVYRFLSCHQNGKYVEELFCSTGTYLKVQVAGFNIIGLTI